MAEFVNLYEELELNPSLSCQEMESELKKLRKKWKSRQNAPTLEVRQEAEIKCKLIEEALEKLTDENKRASYDFEVRQNKNRQKGAKPKTESSREQSKPIDYDDVDSILTVCRQLVEEENASELYRLTSAAIRNGIQNDEIFFYYGLTCNFQENYSEAEKAYKKALELSPNHPLYTLRYAELLANTKRFEESKELFFELYNSGSREIDVVVGLIRVLFELDQEPIASTIIAEFIGSNPRNITFKRIAQKEYLGAILRVKSTYLYQNPTREQIERMLQYAEKAHSILPNNRTKEALEEIYALMPRGGFPDRPKVTGKDTGKDSGKDTGKGTGASPKGDGPRVKNSLPPPPAERAKEKNLNILSIVSLILAVIYPLLGGILGIITLVQAQDVPDNRYKRRGIAAIVVAALIGIGFLLIVAIAGLF